MQDVPKGYNCYSSAADTALTPLTDHLCDTEWGGDEALERVVAHFERNAKRKVDGCIVVWLVTDLFL
jgi:hypothetical protein